MALSSCLFSCGGIITLYIDTVDFSITSPRTAWTYNEDTKIMLAVNADTNEVKWESDIAGALGEGNHLTVFMQEGRHKISAEIMGVRRELDMFVAPGASGGDSRSVLVHYSPMEIMAKQGTYWSYLHAHDGSAGGFRILNAGAGRIGSAPLESHESDWPRRDMRISMPQGGVPIKAVASRLRSYDAYGLGDSRAFFVVNTANQLGAPHRIEAELIYLSDTLAVWFPLGHRASDLVNECIRRVESHIIPRLESIWGNAADIDGDGRIALLFSQTLNDEGLALGFFNPADFFELNADAHSGSYNPASNEMDIIYVAMPEAGSAGSFSTGNIVATIAHEMAHAATFTAKTWRRLKDGNATAAREEIFLEEGWSHLSENLCGLGISGGNVRFLKRFLDDTSAYSFGGPNRLGQQDSVGARGAITLFLSWLFWKAGGVSWDATLPVELVDLGGISFLRRMVELPETGWKSIGLAFGRPTDRLFDEMLRELNDSRISGHVFDYAIDPLTGEAVDFFVNMGSFYEGDRTIHIGFPAAVSVFETSAALPRSVVFFDAFQSGANRPLVLDSAKNDGEVFFSYRSAD